MLRPTKWFGWSRSSSVEATVRSSNNPHSLEQLKVLCRLLEKNQTVSENNRTLLVETLRQIAEILIWGDQNDSTVFDFFLEKNMLYFFLNIMKQKCGRYVCTQLLQTLNILFENIKNETSLYYLLSNNHVNSIIIHKFDFSDEEVMAYYISFLKTLSLKLNSHTIHFFFNEHTADFPLYTEAIKFFNHPEKMVRIAVRTLTLNVFRVQEKAMLRFIRDCTAAPYFSNLSWFIGNHILDLNTSLTNYIETRRSSQAQLPHSTSSNLINRLEDLVAEHLDHLHYLNDILLLNIDDLNNVLSDNLLYRLIIPLYMHSFLRIDCQLVNSGTWPINAVLSPTVAIFLLTQAFIIISYGRLLKTLITALISNKSHIQQTALKCEFTQPNTSLEVAIEQAIHTNNSNANSSESSVSTCNELQNPTHFKEKTSKQEYSHEEHIAAEEAIKVNLNLNSQQIHHNRMENVDDKNDDNDNDDDDDNEDNDNSHKEWQDCSFLIALLASLNANISSTGNHEQDFRINTETNKKYGNKNSNQGETFKSAIERNPLQKSCHSAQIIKLIPDLTSTDDRIILFALSLICSILNNNVIENEAYENIFVAPNSANSSSSSSFYNTLVNSLLLIIRQCSSSTSSIRLVTFELAVYLFRRLTCCNGRIHTTMPTTTTDNHNSDISFKDRCIVENNCQNENNSNDSKTTNNNNKRYYLSDYQIALLEQAREDACHILRQYYCSIDKSLFLNLFEKEAKLFFHHSSKQQQNDKQSNVNSKSNIWSYDPTLTLEQLFMDATLLFTPQDIAINNHDESNLHLRLPGMDYEKARYIIQIFLVLRLLSFDVRKIMGDNIDEKMNYFSILLDDPSTSNSIALDHFIDLENCDLNQCSAITFYYPINNQQRRSFSMDRRDRYTNSLPSSRSESPSIQANQNNKKMPQFMAIISEMIILIEPDDKRYGWGIIRFIARIQDIEKIVVKDVNKEMSLATIPQLPDKDDNRSLYILFNHYQLSSCLFDNKTMMSSNRYRKFDHNLVARFQFTDTVRSLVARNNICKGHKKVLDRKIEAIANLIDYPLVNSDSNSQTFGRSGQTGKGDPKSNKSGHHHQVLNRTYAVPGVAVPSKHSESTSNTNQTSNNSNKMQKRYAYPPSGYVINKTKATNNNSTTATTTTTINSNANNNVTAKISIENDRRKKKKLKFPATNADDVANEDYGIPLNDLSPKTLRKNSIGEQIQQTNYNNANFNECNLNEHQTENRNDDQQVCNSNNDNNNIVVKHSAVTNLKSNRSETFDI